jgi:hypothetical protein
MMDYLTEYGRFAAQVTSAWHISFLSDFSVNTYNELEYLPISLS